MTRDWLDDSELRRCSPLSRAVLVDLLCLAWDGSPVGYLSDSHGPFTEKYMASRMVIRPGQLRTATKELVEHDRLQMDGQTYYFKEMARAEEIRQRRAAGGAASLNNPNVPHRKGILPMPTKGPPPSGSEGYPSEVSKDIHTSRARDRARAGSDARSGSSEKREGVQGEREAEAEAVEQVRRWLYEYMHEEWPMPDVTVATDVVAAMKGANLDELQKFLLQLRKQGRKPEKSWVWFVTVIGTHFAEAHGHQAVAG